LYGLPVLTRRLLDRGPRLTRFSMMDSREWYDRR